MIASRVLQSTVVVRNSTRTLAKMAASEDLVLGVMRQNPRERQPGSAEVAAHACHSARA
jgi:hypothetical protein